MIRTTGEALDGYAPKREEREEEWQPSWTATEPQDNLDDPRQKPREHSKTKRAENPGRLQAFWEGRRRCHSQDHPGERGRESHADDRRIRLNELRGAQSASMALAAMA